MDSRLRFCGQAVGHMGTALVRDLHRAVPGGAAFFVGWIQNREQMPGGDDQLVIAWLGGADRDPRRVVDLFDAVPVDRVALTEAFQGYAAPEASPAREDFRTWKSELDARFGEYVKDVRRYIGVAGAAWSESITTVVGPFRGDWFEELLERIGRRAS